MKVAIVLLLLVALSAVHESDAWGIRLRSAWRRAVRVVRRIKSVYKKYKGSTSPLGLI